MSAARARITTFGYLPFNITIGNSRSSVGRGAISDFITKIARSPIAFLDKNVKEILALMSFSPK
jgi:hypothetical protein